MAISSRGYDAKLGQMRSYPNTVALIAELHYEIIRNSGQTAGAIATSLADSEAGGARVQRLLTAQSV